MFDPSVATDFYLLLTYNLQVLDSTAKNICFLRDNINLQLCDLHFFILCNEPF